MKCPKSVALLFSILSLSSTALAASSCVAFDSSWNLLAFNINGKDYNAGTKDSWASGTPTDITTTGRPPFTGKSVTCHLSQAGSTIYVLGADASNPSAVYIYNAGNKAWSTQATSSGSTAYDPSSSVAILDHDTDVIYAYSKGNMYLLRMENIASAKSETLSWEEAGKPIFPTDGYDPVMGLGSNHIHFLNVPQGQQGFAIIYVIHFGEFQPEPQRYGDFPSAHGKTASVFLEKAAQNEFLYVPDDGSATYVINVITNTTQKLAAPPLKDTDASYFSSMDTFVQYSPSKGISFMPYSPSGDASANSAAKWTSLASLASLVSAGGNTGGPTGGNSAGSGPGATNTRAPGSSPAPSNGANTTGSGSKNNGVDATRGQRQSIVLGMSLAIGLGSIAIALL